MGTQLEKARVFRALHEGPDAFVIPNPWDVGSARILAALGFKALATTSSGFALSLGRLDGGVTLDEKLEHCRALTAAVDIPVSADLENCFADDFEGIRRTITLAAEAGVVGGSIEDYTGDPSRPIYDFNLAVERVHAAVEAAEALDFPFTLTARAENLLWGRYDLDDTIKRLQAFEDMGARVLYAPGLKSLDEVRAVTRSVGKPVNVLAPFLRGHTVADLSAAGVKRISVGGALAKAAIAPLLNAGREMQESGTFEWTRGSAPQSEIERLLREWIE